MLKDAGNVESIVLAAGYSSRAGAFKPLMDLSGRTVLERCLSGMADTCSRMIVVGGYCMERLEPIVKMYPNAELIENPDYPKGMFTSIQSGARAATGERVFITPGDIPLIKKETYLALLQAEGEIILPVYKGMTGHPVLLSRRMIEALLEEPETSCLRDFIQKHETTLVKVDDAGILMDLDTPEDYERILGVLNRRGGNARETRD